MIRYKKYLTAILFYIAGSIVSSIPLFLSFYFENEFFSYIRKLVYFNMNVFAITGLSLFFGLVILFDMFFMTKSENIKRNFRNIEMLLGTRNNILLNFILCLFTGYFEEMLFRGILYYLLYILACFFLSPVFAMIVAVSTVSITFAVFHITQGIPGLVMSFIISVVFFISIFISGTIWYAALFHLIFNFMELTFVIPYQKKLIDKAI